MPDPRTTPVLLTQRLRLAPFDTGDAPDVFAYARNPNVSRYTTWQTHQSIADAEGYIRMVLARPANEHCWAIRLRDEPAVIGAIELGPIDDRSPETQVHYVLAEPHWGRGLMTEAARAVLAWGFANHPALQRVKTAAVDENVGSTRVMQKCGMVHQSTQPERWAKYAEPVQLATYTITREQWGATQPSATPTTPVGDAGPSA